MAFYCANILRRLPRPKSPQCFLSSTFSFQSFYIRNVFYLQLTHAHSFPAFSSSRPVCICVCIYICICITHTHTHIYVKLYLFKVSPSSTRLSLSLSFSFLSFVCLPDFLLSFFPLCSSFFLLPWPLFSFLFLFQNRQWFNPFLKQLGLPLSLFPPYCCSARSLLSGL